MLCPIRRWSSDNPVTFNRRTLPVRRGLKLICHAAVTCRGGLQDYNAAVSEQNHFSTSESRAGKLPFWLLTVFAVIVLGGVAAIAWATLKTPPPPAAAPEKVDVDALARIAASGDQPSAMKLARLYVQGTQMRHDLQKAAGLYRQAADKGNAEAMAALGELYQSGRLSSNGLPVAVELYQKGAELGSVAAQYDLAYLYEKGKGVEKNQTLAAKYYTLAAEGGDSNAQYNIGQRYALGVGVTKDPVEAFKWLSVALQNGQTDANAKLEEVKKEMEAAQITEAKRRISAFHPRT